MSSNAWKNEIWDGGNNDWAIGISFETETEDDEQFISFNLHIFHHGREILKDCINNNIDRMEDSGEISIWLGHFDSERIEVFCKRILACLDRGNIDDK